MSVEAPQPVAAPMPEREEQGALPQILTAGIAFAVAAACFLHFGVTSRAFVSALFVIVLTALAAIDIEQRILPNRIVIPATVVVLLLQIALFPEHTLEWVLSTLGAGLFFLLAYITYRAGLGLGDVKFAFLFVGMFAAGIAGLVLIAREGLDARKKTIPLGPFLVFGAVISLFFNGSDFISF